MRALFIALVCIFISQTASSSSFEERETTGILADVLANTEGDGGGMILIDEGDVSMRFLGGIDSAGQSCFSCGDTLVLTGAVARLFQDELAYEGFRIEADAVDDNPIVVLRGSVVEFLKALIAKHLAIYKGLMNAEIQFILNSLKSTLTYQLVKAIVNKKVGIHALILVPFAYLIDNLKLFFGTAGLLITGAVGGALLLVEYGVYGLVKLVTMVGKAIVAIVKKIIDKFKKKIESNENDLLSRMERMTGSPVLRSRKVNDRETLVFHEVR